MWLKIATNPYWTLCAQIMQKSSESGGLEVMNVIYKGTQPQLTLFHRISQPFVLLSMNLTRMACQKPGSRKGWAP